MNRGRLFGLISYFLAVMFLEACGTAIHPRPHGEQKSRATPSRTVRLEYASSLEPYVDDKGGLILPGQKLEKWSGRTFIGSSSYELVPID